MPRFLYSFAFGFLGGLSVSAQTVCVTYACPKRDIVTKQPIPFATVVLSTSDVDSLLVPLAGQETACLIHGTSVRFGKKDDRPYSGQVRLLQHTADMKWVPVGDFPVGEDGCFSFVVNGQAGDAFLIEGYDEVSGCDAIVSFDLIDSDECKVVKINLGYSCCYLKVNANE